MNKVEKFEDVLKYIKDQTLKADACYLIDGLPDYFFEVPASSTGKYHPSYSLGEGGLVRHVKAAARIAYELYGTSSVTGIFNDSEKDLMIFAIILHDGLKSGIVHEQYTRFDHPILMSNYIKENKDKLTLTDNEIEFICSAIASHMGEWNRDKNGVEVLPLPINKYQKFVHMCDFLASRKCLEVKFDI